MHRFGTARSLVCLLVLGCDLARAPPPAPAPPVPVPPPLVGDIGNEPCLTSAGYRWCAATRSCLRQWETPCKDNYASCADCLQSQRRGVNIACPSACDADPSDAACVCPPPPPCPRVLRGAGCAVAPPQVDECGCVVGCPSVSCDEGASCGGFGGGECTPPFTCVSTMGPMVADAPGTCAAPCATERDAYGHCIPPGCTVWFDGCNTCRVGRDTATATSCTEMMCAVPRKEPMCVDDRAQRAREGEVCHQFCENGSLSAVQMDCADGLECIAPAGYGFDSCGERASRCARVQGH